MSIYSAEVEKVETILAEGLTIPIMEVTLLGPSPIYGVRVATAQGRAWVCYDLSKREPYEAIFRSRFADHASYTQWHEDTEYSFPPARWAARRIIHEHCRHKGREWPLVLVCWHGVTDDSWALGTLPAGSLFPFQLELHQGPGPGTLVPVDLKGFVPQGILDSLAAGLRREQRDSIQRKPTQP